MPRTQIKQKKPQLKAFRKLKNEQNIETQIENKIK